MDVLLSLDNWMNFIAYSPIILSDPRLMVDKCSNGVTNETFIGDTNCIDQRQYPDFGNYDVGDDITCNTNDQCTKLTILIDYNWVTVFDAACGLSITLVVVFIAFCIWNRCVRPERSRNLYWQYRWPCCCCRSCHTNTGDVHHANTEHANNGNNNTVAGNQVSNGGNICCVAGNPINCQNEIIYFQKERERYENEVKMWNQWQDEYGDPNNKVEMSNCC